MKPLQLLRDSLKKLEKIYTTKNNLGKELHMNHLKSIKTCLVTYKIIQKLYPTFAGETHQ